jgi:dihydrofolate reductase
MRQLAVFNNITLDGFFTDMKNNMNLFHRENDPEWEKFATENASARNATLLFGRKTYEMMKSFWPTEEAKKVMPEVASAMETMEKIVFSRTLKDPGWSNARIISENLTDEVRKLKQETGKNLLIMGSGSIVSQLTKERLIDRYTMVIWPIVLGAGRTMFEGVDDVISLQKVDQRTFANGNIVATYELIVPHP